MSAPALSAVLVTSDDFGAIQTTVRHLAAQTIADRLELVVAAPDPGRVDVPADLSRRLHGVQIVGLTGSTSLAAARARAVAAAAAPFVAFAEDHCFPEPAWAEALLAGHSRGWTGVAPRMDNANPRTLLSWAAMFLHFGGVVERKHAFECDSPSAWHNMSYSRQALLETGDRLARLLLVEGFLHAELRSRGHRLGVDPAAVARHVNMSRLGPMLRHAFVGGQLHAGLRAELGGWTPGRRLLYSGAGPLVPLRRLRSVLAEIRRSSQRRRLLPSALPAVVTLLVAHAAGEAIGYLLGVGGTDLRYSEFETRRERFVRHRELALWNGRAGETPRPG